MSKSLELKSNFEKTGTIELQNFTDEANKKNDLGSFNKMVETKFIGLTDSKSLKNKTSTSNILEIKGGYIRFEEKIYSSEKIKEKTTSGILAERIILNILGVLFNLCTFFLIVVLSSSFSAIILNIAAKEAIACFVISGLMLSYLAYTYNRASTNLEKKEEVRVRPTSFLEDGLTVFEMSNVVKKDIKQIKDVVKGFFALLFSCKEKNPPIKQDVKVSMTNEEINHLLFVLLNDEGENRVMINFLLDILEANKKIEAT